MAKAEISVKIEKHVLAALDDLDKVMGDSVEPSSAVGILENVTKNNFMAASLYVRHACDMPPEDRERLYKDIQILNIAYSRMQDSLRTKIVEGLASVHEARRLRG